jgi:hypothetical protein
VIDSIQNWRIIMRSLVIARQKMPPPMEMLPGLTQGFKAWREKYRSKMEMFSFFASSSGGFAVLNTENEAEAYQILLEWPFTPFSEMELHLAIDGDEALDRYIAQVDAMVAGSVDR